MMVCSTIMLCFSFCLVTASRTVLAVHDNSAHAHYTVQSCLCTKHFVAGSNNGDTTADCTGIHKTLVQLGLVSEKDMIVLLVF